MQKLIVGATTLVAVVLGFVLFTSLDSGAQETGDPDDTTTTTILEDETPFGEGFGFGLWGDPPADVAEFLACLEAEGIEVPEQPGHGFLFDLRSDDIEGLAEALETCGLPGLRFGDRLPEDFRGLPFDGFHLPGDLLDEFPEGFPFGEGFEFAPPGLDRDALAACIFEWGSLNTPEDVRAALDGCLPDEPGPMFRGGPHHFGFGFDFEEPEAESSSA
jgi:hypothetical protein